MAETSWSGELYCLKCKAKRSITNATIELSISAKGRETRLARGACPVCGTKMTRFLGKETATA